MAKDYDNNMTGALFVNDKKQSDNHPDRKGSCEIDGVEYWISGWIKKTKDGKQFLSLSFRVKDEGSGGGRSSSSKPADRKPPKDDNEIPF